LNSLESAQINGNHIVISDQKSFGPLEDDRSKYEVTGKMLRMLCKSDSERASLLPFFLLTQLIANRLAKLFFVASAGSSAPLSVENIDQALANLDTVLGTSDSTVDHFILALPNQTFDENELDEAELEAFTNDINQLYLPVWKRLSDLRTAGRIGRLGVSEFSKQQLEILKAAALANGAVAPEVNQVNLQDCCVLPKDLIDYAKAENIELLTHGDSTSTCRPNTAVQWIDQCTTTGRLSANSKKLTTLLSLFGGHRHFAKVHIGIPLAAPSAQYLGIVIGAHLCAQVLCIAVGPRLDHSERVSWSHQSLAQPSGKRRDEMEPNHG